MANYWMHNGFLQVEGRKMAKSEGNFVTINELLETENFGGRKWPGEVLRLAMLMTHYREPIDFSLRKLEEANQTWLRWGRIESDAGDGDWLRREQSQGDAEPSPTCRACCSTISTPRPRSTPCRHWRKPRKPGDRPAADGLIATCGVSAGSN